MSGPRVDGWDPTATAPAVSSGVALPASCASALLWLDPSRLPPSGVGVRAWPSLVGDPARLVEGDAPVSLDASGGVSFEASAYLRADALTIAATAPRSVSVVMLPRGPASKRWGAVWGGYFGVFLNSAGVIQAEAGGLRSSGVTIAAPTLATLTWDGATARLYLGATLAVEAAASVSTSTAALTVGSRGDTAESLGAVRAVGAWEHALDAGAVADLHAWLSGRGVV